MAKHAAGGKVTRTHTSLIDAAVPLVKRADELPYVTKVRLGVIQQTNGNSGGCPRLKMTDIDAGLRVSVRGNKTFQEIYIYTSDRHATARALTEAFSK